MKREPPDWPEVPDVARPMSDLSAFGARAGRGLRVLFITPSYAPFAGGAQAFQEAMAQRLSTGGHQVVILTSTARRPTDFWQPSRNGALPRSQMLDGAQVERLPLAYPWPAPYAFGFARRVSHWLARAHAPASLQNSLQRNLSRAMPPLPGLEDALARWIAWADIVQAADSSWDGIFTAAARIARGCAKPFVAVPLMHLGSPSVRSHFQMPHQIAAYRSAAVVLALSHREAEAYAALGVPEGRIHVIGMGVEPGPVPTAEEVAAFRREHGLAGPMVLFLGATTYDKGAFTLAQAVADLNRSGVAVDLVCAGPSQELLAGYLARRPPAERRLLAGHVRMLGLVDEAAKARLLAACDVLALPSQVEAFGIVFLEAWQHGKPVIGANSGGIPELVSDGENGLLVPFGDRPALVAAIRRILSEPGLGARLGEAGCRVLNERYGWQRTYETMLRIYDRLIAGHVTVRNPQQNDNASET